MVLDYQTETGPKLACRFSMGEYNNKPSFLLQSNKGFAWHNLPPALEALVKLPNMDSAAKNFALGPRGLFWYTYRSVNDVYEQKGSEGNPSLWATLNEDWKGGCPIRLSFGAASWFWGEKEWVEPGSGHLVQAFGVQPPSLIAESKKKYPGIKSYEIDFVAIGMGGAWVMGTQLGDPVWQGITPQLEKTLKRELAAGHKIKSVVLCPSRADIYWIEYADGSIDYFLPTDWDLNVIGTHVTTHVNVPEDVFVPYQLPPPVKTSTSLRPIRQGGLAWNFVVDHFQTGWKHPHKQPAPPIVYIFEILLPEHLHRTYQAYLDKIEKKYRFAATGVPVGNQAYAWHGTRRRCPLGEDDSKVTPCSDAACATCSILLASFNANFAGHAPGRNFLRFGKAIYTSSVSSKADDYASKTPAGYRSLLLARIVKGNAERRTVGDKKLTGPKAGFDCVEGLVGQELNYEETCLYHNDAVRPAFLVLYR